MAEEDLYATLGVPRDANADAIKKQYRKLALQFHPDKNQGNKEAEERFKRINHANDVLSDPKKRVLYDEFGEVGLREGFDAERARQYAKWHSQGGQGPDLNDLFGGEGPVDFGSVFDRFFGGARRGRGQSPFGGSMPFGGFQGAVPIRGPDLEGEVTVEFQQAVRGGELSLNVNGEPVTVRIPPGAREGSRVRVPSRGGASPTGGPAGDLVLTIHVRAHGSFWLEGDDLHARLPITVGEAYSGAKIRVPTPDGDVNVSIPAHTQSGATLRVKGKGVPASKRRAASDLYVHIEVVLPVRDTDPVRSAVDVLNQAYDHEVRSGLAF
jgi:curved DNA-binding protein